MAGFPVLVWLQGFIQNFRPDGRVRGFRFEGAVAG